MRFRGANPVYSRAQYDRAYSDADTASYSGVAAKTSILLGIITVIALYMSVRLDFATSGTLIITGMIIAPIIAFIMVIVTHRRPEIAPFTTVIYAVMEGMFLGLISTLVAAYAGGEVVQMALLGTFGVLAGMLFLYTTGIIRVGAFFRRLMLSMLIGLVVTSLLVLILALLGQTWVYSSTLYFGFSLISVVLSSLYLLIDFDNINQFVEAGVDKRSEWSLALGLVVTIVWLYVELLRLILILTSRD
jgi:uncharacterized YccA/Bax inhibitor family protein